MKKWKKVKEEEGKFQLPSLEGGDAEFKQPGICMR